MARKQEMHRPETDRSGAGKPLNRNRRPVVEDLSVVIPTVGRPILRECLDAFLEGLAWPARIIVVDQSSSFQVAGWLDEVKALGLDTVHVPSTQRGRASGVNRGIERVETCFVAVTDDDCFVEPDWLINLVDKLRAAPDAIVTGRVDPAGSEEVVALMTDLTPAVYRRPRLKHDSMCGGNMGAAKSVLVRLGMFDEDPRLRCAEDCEFSYRALKSGIPIIYAPDVRLRHYGWRDESARTEQYRAYALSIGGFFGKYLRRGDGFIALRILVHHLRVFRRWLRGVLTSNAELRLNGQAYLLGTLPGIIAGFRKSNDAAD